MRPEATQKIVCGSSGEEGGISLIAGPADSNPVFRVMGSPPRTCKEEMACGNTKGADLSLFEEESRRVTVLLKGDCDIAKLLREEEEILNTSGRSASDTRGEKR
jgi:hypothetical protein